MNTNTIDNIIVNSLLNKSKTQFILRKIKKYPNILNYIKTRYYDSFSIKESLFRMRLHINKHPKCLVCEKYVNFTPRWEHPFFLYCSKRCQVNSIESKEKIKNTCLNKYGVDCVMKSKQFKEKSKQTLLRKYEVENAAYLEKTINNSHTKEACIKRNNTKRKNHTFNTSSTEDKIYNILSQQYEVQRNWNKDKRYPWMVDFYIKEIDLFIECNFHWTHCGHAYDKDNIIDQIKLEQWKSKETKYYNNAIYTWTVRDVEKRNKAKQEKLNYVELWSYEEAVKWINENLL